MMHKGLVTEKRIGVVAGGTSAEREVSLKSGRAVFTALKERGYDVVFLDVREDVQERLLREGVEVAFLALHGGWGEDGSIQGMLEVMGMPYTGSGVLASALAMDKEASKKIFLYHGLKVAPFVVLRRDRDVKPPFPPPYVVKPAKEGSSVGVSIVEDESALKEAVEEARHYGDRVIVEGYIEGTEIHIGVLNNRALGGVEVRPKRRFYDYRAKYTPGLTEYILPPEIDDKTYGRAMDVAYRAHRALGCEGATRVDLMIDASEDIYVLEVNTIPGMTETSLLPKIASLAGYDFPSLIEAILLDALRRLKTVAVHG